MRTTQGIDALRTLRTGNRRRLLPSVVVLLVIGVFSGGAAGAYTANRITGEAKDDGSVSARADYPPARAVAQPVRNIAAKDVSSASAVTPAVFHERGSRPSTRHLGTADRTALLVGVNNAPGSPRLEGSIADAMNTRTALLGYGFKAANIDFLADPSRSRILEGLRSLAARTSGDGLAVLLVSTHSRREGSSATFATGGGGRISAEELASNLARVPGKLFSLVPTCFSGSYALPGVVGKDRIAVFSSSSDEYTYQLGTAGSWLVLYMVKHAMIERRAPASIEAAFVWTKATLDRSHPNRSPIISDGIPGDVVLGAVPQ